jgi:hypothetical protein
MSYREEAAMESGCCKYNFILRRINAANGGDKIRTK